MIRSSSTLPTVPRARRANNSTAARRQLQPAAHVTIAACRVPLGPPEAPDTLGCLESLGSPGCPECRADRPRWLAKFLRQLHVRHVPQDPQGRPDCQELKVMLVDLGPLELVRNPVNPDLRDHRDPLDPLGRLEKMGKQESLEPQRLPQSRCPVTPVKPETLDPQAHLEPLENPVVTPHPVPPELLDPPARTEKPVPQATLDPQGLQDLLEILERREFALVIALWMVEFSSRTAS